MFSLSQFWNFITARSAPLLVDQWSLNLLNRYAMDDSIFLSQKTRYLIFLYPPILTPCFLHLCHSCLCLQIGVCKCSGWVGEVEANKTVGSQLALGIPGSTRCLVLDCGDRIAHVGVLSCDLSPNTTLRPSSQLDNSATGTGFNLFICGAVNRDGYFKHIYNHILNNSFSMFSPQVIK